MSALAHVPTDVLAHAAWRRGDLCSWKLDDHQLEIYDLFLEWNERRKTPAYAEAVKAAGATLDDVWCEEIARRFGKTAKWIVMLCEIAVQRPGAVLTYGTAYQKDIGEIIVPMARMLTSDAPDDLKPTYHKTRGEMHEGLYFPNGSVIKLVGVDKHPDALRGRYSDGVVLSEAGFIRGLEELVRAVLLPQFQRRPWAFLALESSTPRDVDHDFARVFKPDANARGAYVTRTIDANTVMTEAEREKWIRQAGGRGHHICDREYYCELKPDPETQIVPEFNAELHVGRGHVPEYAHTYVCVDPGVSDKLAIIWAYWDFLAQKLVVQRSWAESNASTTRVADVMRATERELWFDYGAQLNYWTGKSIAPAPYMRVSDVDKRLLLDLRSEHGISVQQTAKDDPDAQIASLRTAFTRNQIEIWPDSGPLEAQLIAGKRKEGGRPSDWERSDVHGHYDCLVAGTLVATERGDVPIERVCVGDRVWTRAGLRRVTAAWRVGRRDTVRAIVGDKVLEGTPDHRVWTENAGWKPLASLTASDTLLTWASSESLTSSCSTVGAIADTRTDQSASTATTTRPGRVGRCIATSGSFIAATSLRAWTSITRTTTRSTTTSPIWSWLSTALTAASTWARASLPSFARTSSEPRWPLSLGTSPLPASAGTNSTARLAAGRSNGSYVFNARTARSHSWPQSAQPSSAATRASDGRDLRAGANASQPSASPAASASWLRSTLAPRTARVAAGPITAGRSADVYDLTVEGEHEFFANGVLVHNCVAALVYLWRNVSRNANPFPPQEALATREMALDPLLKPRRDAQRGGFTATLGKAMGGAPKPRQRSVWR